MLPVWEDHIAGWDWWAAGGVEGSSHHHALHVVSAGISRATGFMNAPDKDIALYALYALTAVILCVCVRACVCMCV